MTRHDVDVLLAAALLHDVGQYPMAHDFTEVSSEFAHEAFGPQLMEIRRPSIPESLSDAVLGKWGVRLDELIEVWNANADSGFKCRLLKSIISGPLDCDKTDYLRRDSTHLGVTFGLALDHERLLRNITVVFSAERGKVRPEKMEIVGLGVVEKALVVAESLVRARQDLFTQVYWHHTVRSLKAMLGFVIRNTLLSLNDEARKDEFWSAFHEEVLWLARATTVAPSSPEAPQDSKVDATIENAWLGSGQVDEFREVSGLSSTDDDVLLLLRRFAQLRERQVIDAIRNRKLFKRLYVLTFSKGPEEGTAFNHIYNRFYQYRLDEKLQEMEDWRKQCENVIREKVLGNLHGALKGRANEEVTEIEKRITLADPLILLDVPVKAVSRGIEAESIWYVPEDIGGVKSRERENQLAMMPVALEQTPFDKAIGKIRMFSPPDLKDVLLSCIPEDHKEIARILAR
jgi:HD superfamily phosphohydrolase